MTGLVVGVAGLALAMIAGTISFGWWTVPLVAAAWSALYPRGGRAAVWVPAVSAVVAWGLLMVRAALLGPVPELAARLGGIFRVPGAGLILLTLLLAVGLALTASGLASAIRALALGRTEASPTD